MAHDSDHTHHEGTLMKTIRRAFAKVRGEDAVKDSYHLYTW